MANILGKSNFFIFLYNLTFFKRLLSSLILLVGSYLFFYLIVLEPINKELNEYDFSLTDLQKKQTTFTAVVVKRDLLMKEMEKLSKKSSLDNKQNNFIPDLTSYALEESDFKILSKIKKGKYIKKLYEFKIRGDYTVFLKFLNNSLINHPLLKIKKLEIKDLNEEELVFSLNLRLLKFLDEKNK